ncbi:transcription elongation factor GreA [candidate division WWE3 bacterium CG10_big_fil_rev_8_21_14_0_10_32_10]|uniref:Transcription elongation factor GreA n=1 Tax=candidate division WWE3 bacterium CG10_big_fil_rev_8_21_14_0_10_32_10 TaxID=1975090 RepID=A0A2H0R9D0_UNCKA|nr:MAG: transcription elongation factor GreA [candidate division WWE3 bacterium CG10_big_fil_rev_8_21_14_0_10_32_10]
MATNTAVYLTELRAAELDKELRYLKEEEEPRIAKAIKEAREMGSLEDNTDFDLSMDQQAVIAARVREIESLLSNAKIIKQKAKVSSVGVGCKVIVEVEGRQDAFEIVGVAEAAPHQGRISHESPVGKALVGSKIGQEVLVETEVYSTIYKIVDISNE